MKELVWLGRSLDDLKLFPDEVQDEIGYALHCAQMGSTYSSTIYVVNLDDCLYVLHAFQKKSKSGIKTPKPDLNIIETRLKQLKMALQRGEL